MPRIFISYSRKDIDIARRLASDLDRLGGDTWMDVDDIPAGMRWSTAVQQGLDACAVMIVIISPESMVSENVEDEWQTYRTDGKPIIPVLWQPAPMNYRLRHIQHIDFHGQEYDPAFARLYAELQRQGIALQPLSAPVVQVETPPRRSRVLDIFPPPFEWIEIPAGRVTVEKFSTEDVPTFMIAKYPITNAQYAKFVEAGGYRQRQWWTAAGWDAHEKGWDWVSSRSEWALTEKAWTEPHFWRDAKWNGANYPVVGVSWYEAAAFCRWLSEVSGEPVMLPTEQQWQRAAQGDDGREYPWGNSFDPKKCNTNESKIGQTTPVTQYPEGASPFGVMDMAGNVWEWCLTAYETGSTELEGTTRRVLRGGSWDRDRSLARAELRFDRDPLYRSYYFGFRVCVARPPASGFSDR